MTKMLLKFCFPLLVFPFCVSSQQAEVDSLFQVAINTTPPEQVEAYVKLSAHTRNSNADTSLFFAKKAYELAEQSGDDYLVSIASIGLGSVLHVRGSYDLSAKYYSRALELATKEKNDSLRASAHTGLGATRWQLGRHAESLEHHFRSLRIREQLNDVRGMVIARNSIGMV